MTESVVQSGQARPNPDTARPMLAIILQGLYVGGMERGAIQQARCATRAGYDVRLILYDHPYIPSDEQYDPGTVPVVFVPRRYGIDFTLPIRLARLFREWNVDIVHTRNNVAGFYAAAAIALLSSRPRLLLSFDTFPGRGTVEARLVSRWASRRAAKITSVSEDLSARLVNAGWVMSADTIGNGVDPQEFSPSGPNYGLRQQYGLMDSIIVGHVARIDENKRQADLIAALQLLHGDHPDIALFLAGDGKNRPHIEHLISPARNVRLIPRVKDVAAFLREVDIFVLCSDDEGAPRALLEAMMCAKAIIATSVGGIPHILGNCGLLVPPRRPDLLAQSILHLKASRDGRRSLGALARQRALQLFTMDHEWREYASVYESLLPPINKRSNVPLAKTAASK